MRKSYIATLSLLACCMVATLVFSIQTYATRDDVVLEETVIYGDPSRADGLTLDFVTNYRNYRSYTWSTVYTLGNPDNSKTNFGIYKYKPLSEDDMTLPLNHEGLTNEKEPSFYPEDKFATEFDKLYEGKYYRLNAVFDFPTTSWFAYEYDESVIQKERSIMQKYFKIPKYKGDYYEWVIDSTFSDDMCYFTFDLHTKNGNIVDTSLIPDGFGIYAFPYEKAYEDERGKLILGTDTSKLEMIYSLEPDTQISKLSINHEQNHLLLFTIENEQLVLHVIDIANRTELQKLVLFENCDYYSYVIDGAILISNYNSHEVYVVSSLENQAYKIDFTFSSTDELFNFGNFMYFSCYDGERLVYSNFAGYIFELALPNFDDFFIAIYEKNGISYIGTYRSSLLSGTDNDETNIYSCGYQDWPRVSW